MNLTEAKRVIEQLETQVVDTNCIIMQLKKAYGLDDNAAPKKETLRMKARKNVARQFANIHRKIKQSANQ